MLASVSEGVRARKAAAASTSPRWCATSVCAAGPSRGMVGSRCGAGQMIGGIGGGGGLRLVLVGDGKTCVWHCRLPVAKSSFCISKNKHDKISPESMLWESSTRLLPNDVLGMLLHARNSGSETWELGCCSFIAQTSLQRFKLRTWVIEDKTYHHYQKRVKRRVPNPPFVSRKHWLPQFQVWFSQSPNITNLISNLEQGQPPSSASG
mmetsp:Transcript_5022/g.9446  ORF Transcript_5022/g.9446 Transcript_5022/m.9446 type:complete len:207 (-) Transcript_5022:543-1163(-)